VEKPVAPKVEGTFRVVCLGDSSTIGAGVSKEETYCSILEGILKEKLAPIPVEAINGGRYGYSSYQGRILLEKYEEILRPDAVVFYFGANDGIFAPVREDKNWEKVPKFALMMNHNLYINSYFYRFIKNINTRYLLQTMVHPFNKSQRKVSHRARVEIEDFFHNLTAMEKIAKKYNGHVYVVPYLAVNEKGELFQSPYFDGYVDKRVIDLMPPFNKMMENNMAPFVDSIHPNFAGHSIIANLLAEKILTDFP